MKLLKYAIMLLCPLFNVCYIEEISNNTVIQIADIQMPPKMKKGRPKGNGLTVVGLPKKFIVGKQHHLLRSLKQM